MLSPGFGEMCSNIERCVFRALSMGAFFIKEKTMEQKRLDFDKNTHLSSEQIKRVVSEEKKSWRITTIIIAICGIVFLGCTVASFVAVGLSMGIFSLILFFMDVAILLYFIIAYKNRTDREWVVSYAKSKNKDALNIDIALLKQDNAIDRNFTLSKAVDILANGWSASKLLIDYQNKQFIYKKGKTFSKTYKFSDLINYEVYENGHSKVKGRAGSALIGGAFFGLGGLIVGSSMSRNINEKCNQLKLIIRLNDFDFPQIMITYVDNVDWDKNGWTYRNMKENLQSVCSMLEFMLNEKTLEQSSTVKQEESHAKKSNKEQLQELKEMLDDGLITQEDFEQKKKQILGL